MSCNLREGPSRGSRVPGIYLVLFSSATWVRYGRPAYREGNQGRRFRFGSSREGTYCFKFKIIGSKVIGTKNWNRRVLFVDSSKVFRVTGQLSFRDST